MPNTEVRKPSNGIEALSKKMLDKSWEKFVPIAQMISSVLFRARSRTK